MQIDIFLVDFLLGLQNFAENAAIEEGVDATKPALDFRFFER